MLEGPAQWAETSEAGAEPQEQHQAVLAQQVAGLWQAYFQPECDEKPLQKSPNKYRQQPAYPPIRPEISSQSEGESSSQAGSNRLLYVDATLGEAGHARLLLEQQPQAELLGIDADPQMLGRARHFLERALGPQQCQRRCQLLAQRFNDYFDSLEPESLQADLILFDLGISLFHYSAEAARGFSFRPENPDELLDMRLNPAETQTLGSEPRKGRNAADLLLHLDEAELANIFWRYGELHNSRKLARGIAEQRGKLDLQKAQVLADLVWQLTPPKERSTGSKRKIHPATQVFQALRIAVNDELGQLERSLPLALTQLRPYGLMAVITFHSLEDRLVKQQFRSWQDLGMVQWVYKKAVQARYDTSLPSERSAKLRVVRRMIPS